MDELNRSIK